MVFKIPGFNAVTRRIALITVSGRLNIRSTFLFAPKTYFSLKGIVSIIQCLFPSIVSEQYVVFPNPTNMQRKNGATRISDELHTTEGISWIKISVPTIFTEAHIITESSKKNSEYFI